MLRSSSVVNGGLSEREDDPYVSLSRAVVIKCLLDLSSSSAWLRLDALAWLIDDQSSAPLVFDVCGLGVPHRLFEAIDINSERYTYGVFGRARKMGDKSLLTLLCGCTEYQIGILQGALRDMLVKITDQGNAPETETETEEYYGE